MGWKAACIFASPRTDGYLGTFPTHQPEKAKQLLKLLGGTYKNLGAATLEDGVSPDNVEHLYIGAYPEAMVVGSTSLVDNSFDGGVPRIVDHIETMLPGSRVLIITLHSVVDLFGYAWFADGQFIRGRAGSADDGVFFNRGEALPRELAVRKFDEEVDGEGLVMELCSPLLGCRLDEYELWDLRMERFARSWE